MGKEGVSCAAESWHISQFGIVSIFEHIYTYIFNFAYTRLNKYIHTHTFPPWKQHPFFFRFIDLFPKVYEVSSTSLICKFFSRFCLLHPSNPATFLLICIGGSRCLKCLGLCFFWLQAQPGRARLVLSSETMNWEWKLSLCISSSPCYFHFLLILLQNLTCLCFFFLY